ncbi:MAG: HAD family phosphatase [Gammaproteobacteria bacterium]
MGDGIHLPTGIEALIFDLGGVVIEVDWMRVYRHWSRHSPLAPAEMARRFRMDGPYAEHERGTLGAADYFTHLQAVMEHSGTLADMTAGWNAIFAGEIAETVELVRRIHRDIPCYLLTNTNPTHEAVWRRDYAPTIALFEEVFVSSTIGCRKPERAAFEAIADSAGLPVEKFLFFDDTDENVVGARDAGITAVQVRGAADVARALGWLGD